MKPYNIGLFYFVCGLVINGNFSGPTTRELARPSPITPPSKI
jgi:hypothetical protein